MPDATPICPGLMFARASIPLRELAGDWFVMPSGEEVNGVGGVQRDPMYPDPSTAPGVQCIGSRCMEWVETSGSPPRGHCRTRPHRTFADPAKLAP